MKQLYFTTLFFVLLAILAGCKKDSDPVSLTIKIAGNDDFVLYDPCDLGSLSIPVSVVAIKNLNQVKVSIIGSDNEPYVVETIDRFDVKTQFEKTYKGTDTEIFDILMHMNYSGISPKSFLVFASIEGAEASLETPFKTETSDLIINIAEGEAHIVINKDNINAISIPVEVISASSPLTNLSVFITGDNHQEYFVDRPSDFENPHYFNKTYIGTQLGAILSNMQQNGVEPETFCVKAVTESNTEKNACTPIKMEVLPPVITINYGAEIILNENNISDLQIPFTVTSESEDMNWIRTFITDVDGTIYVIEEINTFESPNTGKLFSKTYTIADAQLLAVLTQLQSTMKDPKTFNVQVSSPSHNLVESSMEFDIIPAGRLTEAIEFTLGRPQQNGFPETAMGLTWISNIDANTAKFTASALALLPDVSFYEIITTVEELEVTFEALNSIGMVTTEFTATTTYGFTDQYLIVKDGTILRLVHMTDLKFAAGANKAYFTEKH